MRPKRWVATMAEVTTVSQFSLAGLSTPAGLTPFLLSTNDMDNLVQTYYPTEHFSTEEHTAEIVRKCQYSSSGEVQILARRLAETHDDVQKMYAALAECVDALERCERGHTHWEGCEKHHPSCRAIRAARIAMNESC